MYQPHTLHILKESLEQGQGDDIMHAHPQISDTVHNFLTGILQ